nr:Sterol regulatory element-binding protein ECM22-like protein 1 [Colletotrichum truncatum]KAF6790662.1 Sterol regulatory element-binding protein ECM22-like protein 1 [Colletotrichum truncatum]
MPTILPAVTEAGIDQQHVNHDNRLSINLSSGSEAIIKTNGLRRKGKKKTHTKSRLGCINCKQRRVKCDEVSPTCGNCAKFLIRCSFCPHWVAAVPNQRDEQPSRQNGKKRGRPRKNWNNLTLSAEALPRQVVLSATGLGLGGVDKAPNGQNNTDDFEVLHHYMINTSKTLGDVVWEQKVPILAFRYTAVRHLLLALSALHLARLRAHERDRFQDLAAHHLDTGLQQVLSLMAELNQSNCDALFISSILLCFICVAKEPGPGHLLLVPDKDGLSWWCLIQGVRIVTNTMGLANIFAGVLGPRISQKPPHIHPMIERRQDLPHWERALGNISDLISLTANPQMDMYLDVVEALSICFMNIYGRTDMPKDDEISDEPLIHEWMDNLTEDFIGCLKDGCPLALLILAHYAVLVKKLEFLWYMSGWAGRILCGIRGLLEKRYHDWLQWPQEEIARLGEMRRSAGCDLKGVSLQR